MGKQAKNCKATVICEDESGNVRLVLGKGCPAGFKEKVKARIEADDGGLEIVTVKPLKVTEREETEAEAGVDKP